MTMDFDNLNFDDISIDDLLENAAPKEKRQMNEVFYPGMGKNVVRILPYFSSVKNKWQWDVVTNHHEYFINKERVLCVRETYGEKCVICEFMFKVGKHFGFKSGKFKDLKKKYNLNTKYRHTANVLVVADSGDKGEGDFKRGPYEPGMVLPMQLGADAGKALIQLMADPDYGIPYHPEKGRDAKITVTMGAKYREYAVAFMPSVRPISDSPAAIKEILSRVQDLSSKATRPSPEMVAAVKVRIQEIEDLIMAPTPSEVAGKGMEAIGTSRVSSPDPNIDQMGPSTSPSVPTRNRNLPMVPTNMMGGNGKPMCFAAGVHDATNAECQMCGFESDCLGAK